VRTELSEAAVHDWPLGVNSGFRKLVFIET
jgi:hypothetical protein